MEKSIDKIKSDKLTKIDSPVKNGSDPKNKDPEIIFEPNFKVNDVFNIFRLPKKIIKKFARFNIEKHRHTWSVIMMNPLSIKPDIWTPMDISKIQIPGFRNHHLNKRSRELEETDTLTSHNAMRPTTQLWWNFIAQAKKSNIFFTAHMASILIRSFKFDQVKYPDYVHPERFHAS